MAETLGGPDLHLPLDVLLDLTLQSIFVELAFAIHAASATADRAAGFVWGGGFEIPIVRPRTFSQGLWLRLTARRFTAARGFARSNPSRRAGYWTVTASLALYAAGDYAGADRAFAEAGRAATYDRGLSLAATGEYALALAYFEAVLFVDPADADARFNRDLVAAKVPDVVGESNAIDGVAANAVADGPSEAVASERDLIQAKSVAIQLSILDPRVKSMTAASESWLTTLEDEPALYLKRRIKAEYQRRQDLGLANPPEDTAW